MTKEYFIQLLQKRILILDGGMGTMIQGYHLKEADYRGRFKEFRGQMRGNNDLLNITRPDVIEEIQHQYFESGVDIITTNTFNANAISLADYGIESMVREINLAAGKLTREVVENFMKQHPGREIFVAGSVGPTNKTASMSPDVNDPAFRAVTFDDLCKAYSEQIAALVDSGVDIILFETTFDTLNAKAGLAAAHDVMKDKGMNLPIMLSLTLSAQGGRTFSGQTLEAFIASVMHSDIVSIGLNCSFGASGMLPYLRELSQKAPWFISAYPNAGLPDTFGNYDETPDKMEADVRPFIEEGLVNIIGGCCGTTPQHIARLPKLAEGRKPHVPIAAPDCFWASGLELLQVKPENNFVNIGERCNVAGSRKFLRLIKEEKYEEALTIARKQVEDGAQAIDINMDDGMLDTVKEMTHFLNLITSEPDIARVPVMIDSSKWEVIEAGLKCLQGKSIVNSISLKEGEAPFLKKAQRIHELGAAVVVMAFDEKGQADTFERKTEVCARAYKLLTEKLNYNPHDIIFDPNILSIATGIEEHDTYALAFIRAVEWIKQNLPGALVSGGVSNLSFAFRGNNYLREAMHAVFLYQAIAKGMDMGIVNPSTSVLYEDIEPKLRDLLEDVILCRRPGASEDLITYAQNMRPETAEAEQHVDDSRSLPLADRLEWALVKGIGDYLEEDLAEALKQYPRAVDIIDGPLMNGMNKVGELFGAGKMFLPQVVKTARTMKKAVAILQPVIEKEKQSSGKAKAGKIIFATVKGDVHDIGKNIVSIVLACNNYEVIDLGVMVPAETIVQTALDEKPDFVCLSGLITPSLDEMAHVADEMEKAGLTIPIIVGGATTSKLHTALKIAPHYSSPVIHATDASQNPLIAARLLNPATREAYIEQLKDEYAKLRELQANKRKKTSLLSLAEARKHRVEIPSDFRPTVPRQSGLQVIPNIPVEEIIPYINWVYFFNAWKLNGRFSEIAFIHGCDVCRASWLSEFPKEEMQKATEAMQLFKEAQRMLDRFVELKVEYCKATYGFFPAYSDGDDLVIGDTRFPMLRQQSAGEDGKCKCLADYLLPKGGNDYVGAFAVTAGSGTEYMKKKFESEGDSYNLMLLQTLTDRLAEALAEYLHVKVRREFWGYAPDENLSIPDLLKEKYVGIRPAMGYPSIPDQKMNFLLDKLLHLDRIGVKLTENGAMYPTASVSGLYLANPIAQYFMIGRIDEEQLEDYAKRRGLTSDEIRPLLSKNL
jgi:5-methyltetrahydrofolate--homocysteine methyltransferase